MIRLRNRPLVRQAIELGRRGARFNGTEPSRFERGLGPAPLAREQQPVTTLLYQRLSPDEVADIECRVATSPDLQQLRTEARDPNLRRSLVLSYGMWLGVPSVPEKTKLIAAQPPDHIHSMARGPLAGAGGLYEADLIADALSCAGVGIADVPDALDFGCSSGRVIRVLAASYPEVRWLGCDPNEQAIAWAAEHLPGIEFFVNAQRPPLAIAEASLDLVYAISIWSHFAPELGLRWFDEMHRLIRRGGHLVFTTHGLQSIAFYATRGLRTPPQSEAIADALYRRGWWYASEFGEGGDAGVIDPEWGTAFLSPDWLLTKLCPSWHVVEFAPGRNQANQDVYVLERA